MKGVILKLEVEEIVAAINKSYQAENWQEVKRLNSFLADIEIDRKYEIFQHWPEVVQIELTSKCNAQCIMCSHYYEFNDCGHEISDSVLIKFEELLPYCKLVLLNGYGEPFISKHFIHCLKLLQKYNVKAMITTNLSILTDEMLRYIPDVFSEINVSCNGYDAVTYERVHRGLDFGKFEMNLSRLMKVCDNKNITLSCVAMAETIIYIPEIVRFANKYGIHKIRFGRLGISAFIRNYEQDLIHYSNVAAYYFGEAEKIAQLYGIRLIYPENYCKQPDDNLLNGEIQEITNIKFKYDSTYQMRLRNEFLQYMDYKTYGQIDRKYDNTPVHCIGICDWVAKGLYIDTQGNMFTCCESDFVNYQGNWNSENSFKIRKYFYSGFLPNFCKNCPFILNGELKMLSCEKMEQLYLSNDYLI